MEVVKDPGNNREERLTALVEQFQRPLLSLCYAYLCDASSAEDAVQETFLKAYRALGEFRGKSQVKTWLTRIAINTWAVICQGQISPIGSWGLLNGCFPNTSFSTILENSEPDSGGKRVRISLLSKSLAVILSSFPFEGTYMRRSSIE